MSRWGPAALWALFTIVAVAGGLVAVALIGESVSSETAPVLSAQEVKNSLTAIPQPSASPVPKPTRNQSTKPTASETKSPTKSPTAKPTKSPTAKPTKSPTAKPTKSQSPVAKTFSTRGGSAVAECAAGSAYLRSWSPANGFRVDEVSRGPASEVEIKFHNSTTEVKLEVRCEAGVPVGEQESRTDEADDD